jgi:flagellar biosynthesis/type III secretory pathway protein FliH
VIVTRIGPWTVHGEAILSKEEASSLQGLQLLQERLDEELRQTRQRLAYALLKGRRSARRRGYEQGRKQAIKDVALAFARHMKVWSSAEKHLKGAAEQAIREALGAVPADALLIARINQGLLAARHNPVTRIHVHPSQFALVDRIVAALEAKYGRTGCETVSDLRLLAGEARIETETGVLEVSLDRQVRAICAALLRELKLRRQHDHAMAPP